MRIVIMGSGGVGGVLGLHMQNAGHDVAFVARGAHLRAMQSDGLRLVSPLGTVHVPVHAVETPEEAGAADLIVVAVKYYDLEAVAMALRPMVRNGAVVVPLLNGVEAQGILAEHLGSTAVAAGVARIGAVVSAPGVLSQSTPFADFMVGPLEGSQEAVLRNFVGGFPAGEGISLAYSDAIVVEQWKKLCFLAPFSALTTITRSPIGVPRGTAETAELFWAAIGEGVAVGRAMGVRLPARIEETLWSFILGLPSGMKSSMLEDLERGKRLELPWLSGALVRLGRTVGVATPVNAFVCAALAPFVGGKNASTPTPVAAE
ncbi:MAG: ketopantoate reductase family protein [Rhodospirillaceae bacterium]